jgi:pyrimidine-specific ribonucleoside hydrolase
VAYVISPELFETKFLRVDIETTSTLTRLVFVALLLKFSGQTVCDIYHMTGRPENVHLAVKVDRERFWDLMMNAFAEANSRSPMNK